MKVVMPLDTPAGSKNPAVGIFWCVDGVLVVDRSNLDKAERYGDCITHATGHYEFWDKWQMLGRARLVSAGCPAVMAWTEYDEWPRGRVVYDVPDDLFVLYADRRLQSAEVIEALKGAFDLGSSNVIVRSDPHYR